MRRLFLVFVVLLATSTESAVAERILLNAKLCFHGIPEGWVYTTNTPLGSFPMFSMDGMGPITDKAQLQLHILYDRKASGLRLIDARHPSETYWFLEAVLPADDREELMRRLLAHKQIATEVVFEFKNGKVTDLYGFTLRPQPETCP